MLLWFLDYFRHFYLYCVNKWTRISPSIV